LTTPAAACSETGMGRAADTRGRVDDDGVTSSAPASSSPLPLSSALSLLPHASAAAGASFGGLLLLDGVEAAVAATPVELGSSAAADAGAGDLQGSSTWHAAMCSSAS
jgi:hypothetical protein